MMPSDQNHAYFLEHISETNKCDIKFSLIIYGPYLKRCSFALPTFETTKSKLFYFHFHLLHHKRNVDFVKI